MREEKIEVAKKEADKLNQELIDHISKVYPGREEVAFDAMQMFMQGINDGKELQGDEEALNKHIETFMGEIEEMDIQVDVNLEMAADIYSDYCKSMLDAGLMEFCDDCGGLKQVCEDCGEEM